MDLLGRLRLRLDELARRMLDVIVEEVPVYAHLPREQLEGEILAICRANLEFFLDSLAAGGRPDDAALAEIEASAARRAEERVPLEAVLAAYHVGSRVAWDALQADASPDEQGELLSLAAPLMAYVQAVTGAVSDAYVEERGTIAGDEREARRARLEALLAGGPPTGVAGSPGEPPADEYVAVALALGPSADEVDESVEGAVAARRKLRRVEEFLGERGGEGTLCRLDRRGGIALLPAPLGEAAAVADDVPALVDALAKVADATVTAGVAWRPGAAAVQAAVTEASDVLRLALDLGLAPGAYHLDDVLLEYVVSRPGPGRDRLAARLAALEDGPDLIATLEAWFGADFDRRRAAGALHVHPNTLDYRLKRVADLTGLEPSSSRGMQLLGAALLARRTAGRDRGS